MTETVYVPSVHRSIRSIRSAMIQRKYFILCGVALSALVAILDYGFSSHVTTQCVIARHWQHTITLSQQNLYHGEGWRSEMESHQPFFIACSRRSHGTERCHPRTVKTGRTSTTVYDRCTVYDDYCVSQWMQWDVIRAESTHGSEPEDRWPDIHTTASNQRVVRESEYIVEFNNGKHYRGSLSDYVRLPIGSTRRIRWDRFLESASLEE